MEFSGGCMINGYKTFSHPVDSPRVEAGWLKLFILLDIRCDVIKNTQFVKNGMQTSASTMVSEQNSSSVIKPPKYL